MPEATRSIRWGRVVRIAAIFLLVLAVGWLLGGFFVIVHPKVDHPRHADAIVVLGPPGADGRTETALKLIDEGVAATLVVSVPSGTPGPATRLCTTPRRGVTVTCFRPDPPTTRGEAEQIRRLAREHGWKSIVVVTSTYHISRARMIVKRCFGGKLSMVAARHGISFLSWGYQYLYQGGGFVKAFVERGC